MAAHREPASDTSNGIAINVTIYNWHAGTFKLSNDNYYLTDSTSKISKPTDTVATAVSDNDHSDTIVVHFQLNAGAAPTTIRYYDGTHDVSCTVK